MILVLSAPDDDHATAVVDLLRERGGVVEHVDVHSLSSQTSVELAFGGGFSPVTRRLNLPGSRRTIDLGAATVGWWRRLPAPNLSRNVARLAEMDGAPVESSESLESVVASLDLSWVNHPSHDRMSRRRPRAWADAAAVGLRVPPTVVTSQESVALDFAERHPRSRLVVKPLGRVADAWKGCYTVTDQLELVELVRAATAETVVQTWVPGVDVRTIVVGDSLFTVEFAERGTSGIYGDERPDDDAPDTASVLSTVLPERVALAVRTLVSRLGLVTAAVDLRMTSDGDYVFLDVDPTPRWLLLEELSGWPITESLVDELAVRDPSISGRSDARR